MTDDQLIGKYQRLRAELAEAYVQPEWSARRIDRIANELADLEQVLASAGAGEDSATTRD